MNSIRSWLEQHGLQEHAETFAKERLELTDIAELTDDDVKELGLPLGPRKRLQKAIRELVENGIPEPQEMPATPQLRGEAERRQLTVMFVDLVGSTSLSEGMDTEDYRDLLGAYQTAASRVIKAHGGYIARYMGDGLLVYFGYPVAQENDPERAARAGLAIVDAVSSLERAVPLEVRVGIATGPVIVGDIVGEGASEEAAVLGETPNLAARLQSAAAPNTVLLSPATQDLLRDRVETEALSSVELKGLSRPIAPFRAVRPRSLSEVSESTLDSTPLVGRDVEVALLNRAWRRAQSSEGQAVLLSGEPGVGKSRLLRAFQEGVDEASRTRVQWYCSPYYKTTANYPAIEQFKRSQTGDRLEALEALVRELGLDIDVQVPSLAVLLSIPLSDRYAAPDWSPDELKRRLIQAQVDLLLAAAKSAPVLFVVEDLHWADPTTLEVLGEMMAAIRDQRVLVLMTARLEFSPPWAEDAHAVVQRLTSLSRSETMQLLRGMVEERGLPTAVLEQIVERTDGVPLFVEELTKSLLESDGKAGIPASLQDSLMARLDRLGPTKELAQMAAVIGRSFSLEALTQLADRPHDAVKEELVHLANSGLAHRRTGGEYEFKHALIRDAAYNSLLRGQRAAIHSRVGCSLEQHHPAVRESQPELLAHHFFAGKNPEKAAFYWQRAGERALSLSAYSEAISHLEHVVDASGLLGPGNVAYEQEIEAHSALALAYHAAEGQASKNVEKALLRTQDLCALTGNEEKRFYVLLGLWRVYGGRAEWDEADQTNDELYELSLTLDSPEIQVEAEMARGVRFLHEGSFATSREHLERAARLYEAQARRDYVQQSSLDPGVNTYSRLSWVMWMLGSPNLAMHWNDHCLAHAKSVDHPNSLAMTHLFSAMLHILSGEDGPAGVQTRSAMQLADERGQTQWKTTAGILQGWCLTRAGDTARGLTEMRENIDWYRAGGTGLYQEWFLALLAEELGKAGDIDGAYESIGEAVRLREHGAGLGLWEAEIFRIRGRIEALRGESEAAVGWFERAMATADAQKALALQLRVALERCRLAEKAAIDSHAALASLESILGQFKQGIETADLKAAQTMVAAFNE